MKTLSLARLLPILEASESQHKEPARAVRRDLLRQEPARPELHLVEADSSGPSFASNEQTVDADARQWQEGYEAGVSIGRAQAQSESVDQDAMLRDALAAARAEWVAQESERIAIGVEKALTFMESEICTVASRILSQITTDTIRARAIAEFCAHVRSLMRDGAAGVITVHAPEDMIAGLSESLGKMIGSLESLEFRPHERAEVWVRSGATMIETRLEAWRADTFIEA